ncbi:MAG: 6-phosphofructokinase [Acidobacteriales bacterium]|nr:6-phosphofructokinase [Terriglobales bacterium]
MSSIKRIAVLTSGGDAPGMNAAVRAVVRTAIELGAEVFGAHHGYRGLVDGDLTPLAARDVGGIMQRGGTFLGSARLPGFRDIEVRRGALDRLADRGIGGLIAIGGNGTQTGAKSLSDMGFPVVGVASTIDNDLYGSDVTIGVDTALNVGLEAIDRLKVTASSHHRAFVVEVMGRDCGYLALMTGIAGGAEAICIPEVEADPEAVASEIRGAYERGKPHALVVAAEGSKYNANGLMEYCASQKGRLGFELRATILGHTQRGGVPTFADRMLATELGAAAAERLLRGEHGVLVGKIRGEIAATPFDEVAAKKKPLDPALMDLARVLAK